MRHRSDTEEGSAPPKQPAPLRLRRKTTPLLASADAGPEGEGWLRPFRKNSVLGRIRVWRRLLLLLVWTLVAMPIQAVCLALPGRPKVWFAQTYWSIFSRLLGIRVRVVGELARRGRPVLFVSNHSSWTDIAVLGGVLPASFVSKGEVATWPFISSVARLGRTVFISRTRSGTGRELDAMRARFAQGDSIILFPEGTTSAGTRLRPFRSSFFAVAEGKDPPLVQPVSMAYDRLAGLPTGRLTRSMFAWVGDQDIASHYMHLGQQTGLRATVLLHRPIDPRDFRDRKALSEAVRTVIADGASILYQHRTAAPLEPARPAAIPLAEPAGRASEA